MLNLDSEIPLDSDIQTVVRKLNHVGRRQRRLRAAGAIVCLGFIASLGIGGQVLQRVNADARARDRRSQAEARARDKRRACDVGNQFRMADKARWDKLISISPPPSSEAGRKIRQVFIEYIDKADALRDCSHP